MQILDISVSKTLENIDRRSLGYNRSYKTNKKKSPYQWPHKYGMKIKDSIKNKNWELRKYNPSVVSG